MAETDSLLSRRDEPSSPQLTDECGGGIPTISRKDLIWIMVALWLSIFLVGVEGECNVL
jgi:hypothetical protein